MSKDSNNDNSRRRKFRKSKEQPPKLSDDVRLTSLEGKRERDRLHLADALTRVTRLEMYRQIDLTYIEFLLQIIDSIQTVAMISQNSESGTGRTAMEFMNNLNTVLTDADNVHHRFLAEEEMNIIPSSSYIVQRNTMGDDNPVQDVLDDDTGYLTDDE